MNLEEEIKSIVEDIENTGFKAEVGLTPLELSKYLSLSTSMLENWRRNSLGPEYITFGRKVIYPKKDIAKYLISRHVRTM